MVSSMSLCLFKISDIWKKTRSVSELGVQMLYNFPSDLKGTLCQWSGKWSSPLVRKSKVVNRSETVTFIIHK